MTQICTYCLTQKNLVLSDKPDGNGDYSPDLCFVTTNNKLEPLNADRKVLDNFPHSQHLPILITIGMNIPTVQSIPRARWNFRKANWAKFTSDVEQACVEIPARQEDLETFGKLS